MADDTGLTGQMFVGGARVAGTAGEVRGEDPWTGEALDPAFGLAGPADVVAATSAAADASATFAATSGKERAALLEGIAAGLEALGDVLVERVVQETAIAEQRVRGELARTTGQLRSFATLVDGGGADGVVVDPERPLRRRLVPVGPVAVFGASNFPLAFSVAGGDTASALAAGCPVVVKAHSAHPGTSELVAGAIARAVAEQGLPGGVFSLLFGEADVATALVADPRITAVGFTGSARAGTALVAAAAARPVPVPVFAEMSSVNPVVLLPGALAERAADLGRDFVASLTTGSGQLCTCPGLVLAARGADLDTFVAAAAEAVRDQRPTPMLSPSVHGGYLAGLERLDAAGATVVAEGAADDVRQAGRARLLASDAGAVAADPRLREEVFGPAAVVVTLDRLDSADDVAPLLAALGGQLTATLHVGDGDLPLARDLVPHLERLAGRIVTGGWPTGVEVVPAMVHGGPFPATSDARSTSVGTAAIDRFLRPVAYQGFPPDLLPDPLG